MGDENPKLAKNAASWMRVYSLFRVFCCITLQEWSSWVKKGFTANTCEFLPKIENNICFSCTASSFFHVDFSILLKVESTW